MFTTAGKILIACAVIAILSGILFGLISCTRMFAIDEAIWSPITETPGEKAAGHPPPLLEVIAGALATIGFAGMALWIRRNKKRACSKADVETIVKDNNTPA